MQIGYDRIAGQNLERLAALTDGVFAVAMTLLVLDIHAPAVQEAHNDLDLAFALRALLPRLAMYLMSFLTLGIFWTGQQTQLNQLSRADRHCSWLHLAFLASVCLMPFSTSVLAGFIQFRLALVVYWFNILLLGTVLFVAWRHCCRSGLVKTDSSSEMSKAIERRILLAQALYGAGALLCFINTYWSIGFIIVVQLNYAFAPRLPSSGRKRGL